jgi:hypothetical protein
MATAINGYGQQKIVSTTDGQKPRKAPVSKSKAITLLEKKNQLE